ncbi:transglycosylase SLT domain-containing protein [Thermodesulfobacteriota bacterium]
MCVRKNIVGLLAFVWLVFSLLVFVKGYSSAFDLSKIHCERYKELIQDISQQYGINPRLTAAIMYAESACESNAMSQADCIGLMQILPIPGDARRRSDYLTEPEYNIRSGVSIFREFYDRVDSEVRSPNPARTLELALACYNAGPESVRRAGWNIPDFSETKKYVPRVIRFFKNYGNGPALIRRDFFDASGTGPIPRFGQIHIRAVALPRKGEELRLEIHAWNLGDETDSGELVASFPKEAYQAVRAEPAENQSCQIKIDDDYTFVEYQQRGWPKMTSGAQNPLVFRLVIKPVRSGRLAYYLRLKLEWQPYGHVIYPSKGPHDTADEPAPAIKQVIDVQP